MSSTWERLTSLKSSVSEFKIERISKVLYQRRERFVIRHVSGHIMHSPNATDKGAFHANHRKALAQTPPLIATLRARFGAGHYCHFCEDPGSICQRVVFSRRSGESTMDRVELVTCPRRGDERWCVALHPSTGFVPSLTVINLTPRLLSQCRAMPVDWTVPSKVWIILLRVCYVRRYYEWRTVLDINL